MGERKCAGLRCCDVPLANGSEGPNQAFAAQTQINNLGNFLLLNPDFFFFASGPAQKAVLAPSHLFFGVVFMTFFFSQLFFNPRKISVGAFSRVVNAKMPCGGQVRKCPKPGLL
jgi:hypothetical protein